MHHLFFVPQLQACSFFRVARRKQCDAAHTSPYRRMFCSQLEVVQDMQVCLDMNSMTRWSGCCSVLDHTTLSSAHCNQLTHMLLLLLLLIRTVQASIGCSTLQWCSA
jgi:hypothetical protein